MSPCREVQLRARCHFLLQIAGGREGSKITDRDDGGGGEQLHYAMWSQDVESAGPVLCSPTTVLVQSFTVLLQCWASPLVVAESTMAMTFRLCFWHFFQREKTREGGMVRVASSSRAAHS